MLVHDAPHPVAGAQTLPLASMALTRQLRRLADEIGGEAEMATSAGCSTYALLLPEAKLLLAGIDHPGEFADDALSALTETALREGHDVLLAHGGLRSGNYDFFFNRGFHWSRNYTRWDQAHGLVFVPADPCQRHLVQVGPGGLIVTPLHSNDEQNVGPHFGLENAA